MLSIGDHIGDLLHDPDGEEVAMYVLSKLSHPISSLPRPQLSHPANGGYRDDATCGVPMGVDVSSSNL